MKTTDDRSTPNWFFDELDKEFHFNIDVCADERNRKCEKYFSIEMDGLRQEWAPYTCWMNPSYSEIKI